jgi:hypothetical protein
MSMKILFTELFESFEDFELAGDVEHLHSNFVAGIKHMPMVAKARAGAGRSLTEMVK